MRKVFSLILSAGMVLLAQTPSLALPWPLIQVKLVLQPKAVVPETRVVRVVRTERPAPERMIIEHREDFDRHEGCRDWSEPQVNRIVEERVVVGHKGDRRFRNHPRENFEKITVIRREARRF